MIDHSEYWELLKEQGIEDINEILSRNNYHSPEESDPENDPNASTERKKLLVYKLNWRTDKVNSKVLIKLSN